MSITSSQYDEIMHSYYVTKSINRQIMQKKIDEIYNKIPNLKDIDDKITSIYINAALNKLNEDNISMTDIEKKIQALTEKKEQLLIKNGFSKHDLSPIYTCKKCKDIGFIQNNRCDCFNKKLFDLIFNNSNIKDQIKDFDFNRFSLNFYKKESIDNGSNKTEYELAKKALDASIKFTDDLINNKDTNSLLFYGNPGVGKTFLLNCIAKKLLQNGISVVYFTAVGFFEFIRNNQINPQNIDISYENKIITSDVLMIDDLATENVTDFSRTTLFYVLNERINNNKPTVISTNLNPLDIKGLYSERISSRIIGNFGLLKICGDDIRLSSKI